MSQKIHTLSLDLTMKLINEISKVDRFDASWTQIEKREGQTLKQLKAIATVRSVGASTRIEGSKLTDKEVEVLIDNLKILKLEKRDEQEVAGYFEALDAISESYNDINITEGNIKTLHNILMKYCEKDEWHRGNYKQVSNAVEATHSDGTKQVIFKTTEPGHETEESMRKLFEWYHTDNDTLSIVKDALFIYDFLSIHPFQDGNGRLSRLLGTLLLLKHGYSWIQYVSFEHEIENRKAEYYKVLMNTQRHRPGENVNDWLTFFLDCLMNIQDQLMEKLQKQNKNSTLSSKEKNILAIIENNPGIQSGEIAERLQQPASTIKKILTSLAGRKIINKTGIGKGTSYTMELESPIRMDMMFQLTNGTKEKEFTLRNQSHFIEIKKILLTPLFEWIKPDEWATRVFNQGIGFKVSGYTARQGSFSYMYFLSSFVDPFLFQPVFNLHSPINIPISIKETSPNLNDYPIRIVIEVLSSTPHIDFDIMFVYDSVLD